MEELKEEEMKKIREIAEKIGTKAIMDAVGMACNKATEELKKNKR